MVMKARICIGRYSYRPDVASGLRILGAAQAGQLWSFTSGCHLKSGVSPKRSSLHLLKRYEASGKVADGRLTGMGLPTQAIHTALLPQPQGDSLSSFPMKSLVAGLKMFLF